MKRIKAECIPVNIYESTLEGGYTFFNGVVVNDMAKFKAESDVILANRFELVPEDVVEKVYTRFIFMRE